MNYEEHYKEGWEILYALRRNAQSDIVQCRQLLQRYLQLYVPRPSVLHSAILEQVVLLKQEAPQDFSLLAFMRLWEWINLRPADWIDSRPQCPSMAEALVSLCMQELSEESNPQPDEAFVTAVSCGLQHVRPDTNLWYHYAKLYLYQGKNSEALEIMRYLLRQGNPRHFLWSEVARLVSDPPTRCALLCKALICCPQSEFSAKFHLQLAASLLPQGQYGYALGELLRYHDECICHGWHVGRQLEMLMDQLPANTAPRYIIYAHHTRLADAFLEGE